MEYILTAALAVVSMLVLYRGLGVSPHAWQGNAVVAAIVSCILIVPFAQFIAVLPLLWGYQFALLHVGINHRRLLGEWRILINRTVLGRDVFVAVGVC